MSSDDGRLFHLLFYPKQLFGRQYPLVLLLHSSQGSGEEMMEQWREEAEKNQMMLLAVTRRGNEGASPQALSDIQNLVAQISKEYPVDPEKKVVVGVSAGAWIGRELVLREPAEWAKLVLIASPGFDGDFARIHRNEFPEVLYVHGEKDEQFPFKEISEEAQSLGLYGIRTGMLSSPNRGHEFADEWLPTIFDWIRSKKTSSLLVASE